MSMYCMSLNAGSLRRVGFEAKPVNKDNIIFPNKLLPDVIFLRKKSPFASEADGGFEGVVIFPFSRYVAAETV